MKINIEEFQKFSGVFDTDEDTQKTFLDSAIQIVESYLGFGIEDRYQDEVPTLVRQTCYRIATLLELESDGNLGVNSKSFEGGSRSFLNVTNYDSYLKPLSELKLQNEIKDVVLEGSNNG